ncbi:MAG: signal peptidase I [Clostridiales bacterium GWE2_32_10]|nr:MAG: signal peptidase I [Clostridiales bacterium GWE2_32_10]HBY20216.1 signal peptidase I [Clostridiales bacterium]
MINNIFKIQNPVLKEIFEWVEIIIIALLIVVVLRTYVVEFTQVSGPSMQPTLQDENRLIINRFIYNFEEPKRGDVVVFDFNKDTSFIKRVIGVPGDKVDIKDGDVYVNDKKLEEHYIKEKIVQMGNVTFPVTVTKDHYFVMGDNRNNSSDSRFKMVGDNGLVAKKAIRGPVIIRIWPFNEFGTLKSE